MKMTQQSKCQGGFSLAELLVAITILTVGLLAVAAMQTVALNRGGISYKIATATSLAQGAMDDIMSWDRSDPILKSSVPSPGNTYANNASVTGGGTFKITYTTAYDPVAGMTTIKVTATDTTNSIQPITVTVTDQKKVL